MSAEGRLVDPDGPAGKSHGLPTTTGRRSLSLAGHRSPSPGRAAPNGPTFPDAKCFDDHVVQFMRDNGVPGATVSVAYDGRLVYKQGYGNASQASSSHSYTQVGGVGWCTDARGNEGTARYFVSTRTAAVDDVEAACDRDPSCVAIAYNHLGSGSVLYSNGRKCTTACHASAWIDDPTLIVGSSGVAGYSCFVKSSTPTQRPARLALPTTPFRWASVSKPVTAWALMALVDRGLVGLDDKVFECAGPLPATAPLAHVVYDRATCSPRFTIGDPRALDITVRHLLQHTGGWDRGLHGDSMFMSADAEAALGLAAGSSTCEDILSWELGRPTLQHAPGSTYSYSNLGYCALGLIIAKVWGDAQGSSSMAYGDAVRALLLDPAGVTPEEMYLGADQPTSSEAIGDCEPECGADGAWPGGFDAGQMARMDAHGGWVASSEALMKLVLATTEPHCAQPDCLLSTASQAAIMADPGLTPGPTPWWYGLGFAVNTHGNSWHAGSMPGTNALLVRTSGKFAWSIALNTRDLSGHIDPLMWDAVGCVEAATWQVCCSAAPSPPPPPQAPPRRAWVTFKADLGFL